MCVPILRSIGTKLMNLKKNMQKSYDHNRMCYLTSRAKNGTLYVIVARTLLIDISIRNILQATRSLYDFRSKTYG